MENEKRRSGNGNWLLARLLLKDRWTRPFVDNAGKVLECDTHGDLLLNILADRKSKKNEETVSASFTKRISSR